MLLHGVQARVSLLCFVIQKRCLSDAVVLTLYDASIWPSPNRGNLALQVLDLSCCRGVTDAGVAAVAAAGRRLHSLSLSSCHRLTDAAFGALGARCGALVHLNACGCELLGDTGLTALAAGAGCVPKNGQYAKLALT